MTQVVPLRRVGGSPPDPPDAFAVDLRAAAEHAIQAGATAAVLIFFDGARQLDPVAVHAPHPMARGMTDEAADYYHSRVAGYSEK